MAKKQKNTSQSSTDNKNPYSINTDAVDRLVNAKNKTYPKTKSDPGRQYKSNGFFDKIPSPVKALAIKFWFNGAICFFIYWGLGLLVPAFLDMIVVMAIVSGMVNDLLVNNAFHFFSITPGSNNKWMMFPQRKFWTFFANIIYAGIVLVGVMFIYSGINLITPIGVEPILFGLSYTAVDMLFIGMKNLVIKIFEDASQKAKTND